MKFENTEILKRWRALSGRERLMLMAGVGVLSLYALYQLAYRPLLEQSGLLQQQIQSQRQIYQHLQQVGAEVEILRQSGVVQIEAESASQPPMALIDASSQQLQIKPAIKSLQQEGDDQVAVSLEQVSFDKLIYWLAILETKHGLRVLRMDMADQAEANGLVSVKLMIGRG